MTGKIKEELMEKEEEETPLQAKLGVMAELIGYVGMGAALLTLIAIVIRKAANGWEWKTLLDGFIVAVTIVVVAVPEGLPLAVTIALAYSMNAMYDENIFVKVLSACETMGGATCICSDKTGTLTQGIMTVTGVFIGGKQHEDSEGGTGCVPVIPDGELKELFCYGIAVNSDAQVTTVPMTEDELAKRKKDDTCTTTIKRIGNFTECALLSMLDGLTKPGRYLEDRKVLSQEKLKVKSWPFDSAKKRMSIVVKHKGKDLMFTKGAAEQVLKLCSNWMNGDSVVAPLDDTTRQEILTYLSSKTKQGFRLLLMAYKEMPQDMEYTTETPDEDLTLLGVTAILDPLREEVPDSVESCRKAGIKVIMVTGDHKDTAQHIAGKCGIYHADQDGVVMEASEFRKLYDEAFLAQHGTRLQRYVKREEQQVGDEMESTLSPYLSEGQPLHWKEAIGPCCQKEPRHVLYGQKEKATNYQGFASGLVRGKPPQLDMWAYGVSNKYDPAKWDKEMA